MAKCEIKGSDLRRDVRTGNRNRRRAVFGFLDQVFDLLENNDAKLVSRIYVKEPGQPFKGKAVYMSAMQALCAALQRYLEEHDEQGLIIADSRTPSLNSGVSHSIFTQKFKVAGDPYSRLIEMPTFGHSENHVPLQITDLLCSAVLSPMATSTYCSGIIRSCHVHERDASIRERYAERIRQLGYRYQTDGRWRGGITVNDQIGQRSPTMLSTALPQ
jgi:hypothetical protein